MYKKICISFLLIFSSALAYDMTITSNNFFYENNKNKVLFDGNVTIKQDENTLSSNKLILKLGKNKKILDYHALGNVNFNIDLNNTLYSGRSNSLFYDAKTQNYTLIGDVFLKDQINDRQLEGDKVILNNLTKNVNIESKKGAPVKFKLKLNDI